jgi:hypothetical protein
VLYLCSALLLVGAIATAFAVAQIGDWDPWLFTALLVLVVGVDQIDIEGRHMAVSGSILGLLLAMVLLGPTAAAAIGVTTAVVDGLRQRPRAPMAAWNVVAWAWFPLAGGLVIHALADALGVGLRDLSFVFALLPGYVVATAMNFGFVAVGVRILDGVGVREQLRRCGHLQWPHRGRLKWPHLASVVVVVDDA